MDTNRIILAILVALLPITDSEVSAQPSANLSGTWLASSGSQDNPCEAYFQFTHVGDSLQTNVSLPRYGNKFMQMPLPPAILTTDTIRLPTFDGVYYPNKDQILAQINFLYEALPFTLTRVEKVGAPVLDTSRISARKPAWTFAAGGRIWSAPVLYFTQLMFGCDDSCFYAIAPATGKLLWKFKTGGRVRGKAATFDRNICFTSDDGYVYCIAGQTGKLIWKSRINDGKYLRKDPSMTDGEWDYKLSSPVVSGKTMYVGSTDSCLYALEAATGKIRWKFKTDHIIRATPQVAGSLVFCGNWAGKFYSLQKETGDKVWQADLHQSILSQPAIENNRLIIGSRHAWLWCFDALTGHEIWKYNYWWSWVESSPVIEKGIAYIGSSDLRRMLAINTETGKTLWSTPSSGYPYTTATVNDNTVFMGTLESNPEGHSPGYIYLLDKSTGQVREKIEVPTSQPGYLDGIFGQLVIDKTRFYAATLEGKIQAYSY